MNTHHTYRRPGGLSLWGAWLSGLAMAFVLATVPASPAADPAEPYLALAPGWSDRVLLYDGFERDTPEVNAAGAAIDAGGPAAEDGFLGRGYRVVSGKERRPLSIKTPALSPHRPFTLMVWWRLDEPMREDLTFCLFYGTAPGRPGFVANAVHGKSNWCGLRQPTYISQVWGFPGIVNHHNQWSGRVWPEAGEWHHWALTATGAATLTIYWDGRPRETIPLKGRPFAEGDLAAAGLGTPYSRDGKPDAAMTLDEVILLDRALTPDEVAAHVKAMEGLRELAAGRQP